MADDAIDRARVGRRVDGDRAAAGGFTVAARSCAGRRAPRAVERLLGARRERRVSSSRVESIVAAITKSSKLPESSPSLARQTAVEEQVRELRGRQAAAPSRTVSLRAGSSVPAPAGDRARRTRRCRAEPARSGRSPSGAATDRASPRRARAPRPRRGRSGTRCPHDDEIRRRRCHRGRGQRQDEQDGGRARTHRRVSARFGRAVNRTLYLAPMSRALGRYELLRPLARGGMGEVYLARRRAAGVEKWLVVKRMRPERAGDARFLDLFMREAKLSMSLAHQNIVPVFDFGRIDDQVFLAMERVEGKDLGSADHARPASRCRRSSLRSSPPSACQALDYAHHRKGPDGTDLGIVHRDVTPRNVLLSWSGEVKLTDFGIARARRRRPAHGKMAGTPAYMAPEQARGEPTRRARGRLRGRHGAARSDHGRAAAQGRSRTDDRSREGRQARAVARRASTRRCERSSSARPPSTKEDRYPDARAMLEALDEFIVGERAAQEERSARAPARGVARRRWEGASDEVAISDGKIEAGELMSFLDDGALDVIGTGTQRSMAATARGPGEQPAGGNPRRRRTRLARGVAATPDAGTSAATARPAIASPCRCRRPASWRRRLAAGAGAIALAMQKRAALRATRPPVAVAAPPPVERSRAAARCGVRVEPASSDVESGRHRRSKPRKRRSDRTQGAEADRGQRRGQAARGRPAVESTSARS